MRKIRLFRSEFKTKKDCKKVSKFMCGYNSISSIVAILLFAAYIIYTVTNTRDASMDGFQRIAVETTRQINDYLKFQTDMLEYTLYYIDEEDLTKEEAMDSISYHVSLDGDVILIDTQTLLGEVIFATGKEAGRDKTVDIKTVPALRRICENKGVLETASYQEVRLSMSEVFENPIDKENAFALYRPINLGEKTYLFCYIMDTSLILDKIAKNTNLIERGILIDSQVRLLGGKLGDDNRKEAASGTSTLEQTEQVLAVLRGENTDKEIQIGVSTDNFGIFILRDGNRMENIYIYVRIESLGDWYYISRISEKPLVDIKMILALVVGALAFIGLPWCFNVIVVFWQNRRLMRMLSTLEENNEQLEAANKAQTAFISSMSHEIRTPINAILGMDEMIIRESQEDAIKGYALDIRNAGKSLLGIVNDILDFTKIEAGKMDIIEEEYELSSMINDLANMTRARLGEKNVQFKVVLNPHTPHLLYGDEIRIKQIILNMLTNAVKYTQQGEISLQVTYEKVDEEKIALCVAVKDTGIGMKPEEMDKLFKPFERLDEKKNRTIEGTGLGMSIVTGLLEQMGSHVEVQSEYGKGSVFSFRLEQKVLDWEENGPYTERLNKNIEGIKEEQALFTAHKAQILVVDDTAVNLTVAKGLLKRTCVCVDTATSGKECLRMLEEKAYHVVLLDHRMPEMDGVETLRQIRLLENENRNVIVIALTANAISGAKEYYLREGFNDYLTKPINGNRLESMIVKYLPEEVIDTEEDLAVMVDEQSGIGNCGTEEVYRQTVTEVVRNADKICTEIETYLQQEDIRNYTIKVHALKSTARLLGALKLSEEALYLENCGDAGDKAQIQEKTPTLLRHFKIVADALKEQYEIDTTQEEKPLMEPSAFKEALLAMQEFCAAFDFEQVDNVLKTIESYRSPEDAGEMMEALKSAVYDINQEQILQLINEYLGGWSNE